LTQILQPEFDAQQKALEILARRKASKGNLLPFISTFLPSYDPGWVHKDICRRLERFSQQVANKEAPRLMLFLPPRHGKSEIVSRNFPAWHLGHYPEHEIIGCSYAGSLANKFSRKVREIMREREYASIFDTRLHPEAQNIEHWLTTEGGGYMSAGVSGPLSGNGMHIGIIDDPVKNREEAESETVRQTQKDWYTSTFYTRLAPGAGILIVQTRWHDDDISGWQLREMLEGGDQWEVVCYPAIATEDETFRKKGEPLHASRYNLDALKRIQRAVGPRDWQALYQQTPTADEGEYFTKNMIRYYRPDELPDLNTMTKYTAWDLAIGKKDTNDWSVGITVGVDRKDRVWVLDLKRGRWDGYEIVEQILDNDLTWEADIVGIEKGHIEMALGPFLEKRIQERGQWSFHYEGLKTGRADKIARSRPIQGRMHQGMVLFPSEVDWVHELTNELLRFPSGVHDDQVDALAWIGQMMQEFTSVPVIRKHRKSWKDKLDKFVGKSDPSGSAMSA
jgi:predicted phage terminase large subunit-like protein